MDKTEYKLEMLDNGIKFTDIEADTIQCEKFGEYRDLRDAEVMWRFLGKFLWEDILGFTDLNCVNNMKITISIEKDE